MKIRTGFVSNSSSSSYMCQKCGGVETCYEGPAEADMVGCEKNHIFHVRCLGDDFEKKFKENESTYIDEYSELIKEFCPICNMEYVDDETELKFLRKISNIKSKEELLSKVKNEFGITNYNQLKKFVGGK